MERFLTSSKRKKSTDEDSSTSTDETVDRSAKRLKKTDCEIEESAVVTTTTTTTTIPSLPIKNASVSDTLLIPLADLNSLTDFESHFRKMAQLLLNEVIFWIGNKKHRLTEVEFYVTTAKHNDPFTHCDDLQKVCGNWYFHRTGNAYRGGSYKGLDISLGFGWDNNDNNKNNNSTPACSSASSSSSLDKQDDSSEMLIGGILFRGIEELEGNHDLTDGPSLSVDRILKFNKSDSIPEFVRSVLKNDLSDNSDNLIKSKALHLEHVGPFVKGNTDADADADDDNTDVIKSHGLPPKKLISCPRVGLSLKNASKNRELQRRFLFRDYRFLTEPKRIKKGKHYMVLGLHRQGCSDHEIHSLIGTPLNTVRRYVELYKQGKDTATKKGLSAVENYYGESLSTDDLCKLCGAIDGQKE